MRLERSFSHFWESPEPGICVFWCKCCYFLPLQGISCPGVVVKPSEGIRISLLIKVFGVAFVNLVVFSVFSFWGLEPMWEHCKSYWPFLTVLCTFTKWLPKVLVQRPVHGPWVVRPSSAGLISLSSKNFAIQVAFSKAVKSYSVFCSYPSHLRDNRRFSQRT